MTSVKGSEHIPHKQNSIAYHIEWEFSHNAVVVKDGWPRVPNIYPVASNLRDWMMRKADLRYLAHSMSGEENAPTNPYSYESSMLALAVSDIINESHAFANREESDYDFDVEMRCTRYASEFTLYSVRLCEALIKQLLFCTDFRRRDYKRAAIGSLLSSPCNGCRNSEEKRHNISLLGSLGHRYHLCHGYEKCLHEKLEFVNRHRNQTSAHSGILPYRDLTVEESKAELRANIQKIGDDLEHLLRHIGDIENKMKEELHDKIDDEVKHLNAEGMKFIQELYSRDAITTQDPLKEGPPSMIVKLFSN